MRNLAYSCTEEDLEEKFQKFGKNNRFYTAYTLAEFILPTIFSCKLCNIYEQYQ